MIPTLANDLTAQHQQGTDRYFALLCGFLGKQQRPPHEVAIARRIHGGAIAPRCRATKRVINIAMYNKNSAMAL